MIGISIANSLGLNKLSGINPDAAAFIAAAGITGTTQVDAVNTLVNGLQADGLWSKMKAVYPFVTDNRNLLNYTTTFAALNYLSDNTATFTLNNTIAPDGTNTGVRFTAVGSNNSYFYTANTIAGNNFGAGNKAFSIYVKAGTFSGSASLGINSDGSVTRNNFSLTNEWQRVTVTRNVIVAGGSAQYYIDMNSITMTSGQYFYIWAPQFESGTTATTYQPILTTQQAYIASQFKYNLKDPRDLDAAFRLVFNGGWTHSSTGATPNGTNGYADTKLVPSSVLSQNSTHLSYYSRTNSQSVKPSIHSLSTLRGEFGIYPYYTGNVAYSAVSGDTGASITTSINSLNYYIANRTSSTSDSLFTGLTKATRTVNSILPSTSPIFIAAQSFNGTATAGFFDVRQCAFSTIGDGLTDTEAANLYTRVQAFQNSLNRAVI